MWADTRVPTGTAVRSDIGLRTCTRTHVRTHTGALSTTAENAGADRITPNIQVSVTLPLFLLLRLLTHLHETLTRAPPSLLPPRPSLANPTSPKQAKRKKETNQSRVYRRWSNWGSPPAVGCCEPLPLSASSSLALPSQGSQAGRQSARDALCRRAEW